MARPAIVIHGGAGEFLGSTAKEERVRTTLSRVVREAFFKLKRQSAVDVVTWAVSELEDDPLFNAGTGGNIQRDGTVRLTASLMDGNKNEFSGVVNIENVKNPIQVARFLAMEHDRVLCGEGAQAFARRRGFGHFNPLTEERWHEWQKKLKMEKFSPMSLVGTVGAVAVGTKGDLAAATSTGGKGMEMPGRMSDSATVAGNYATKKAAVSATGVGEEIVEAALAARIVTRVDDGMSLSRAFGKTFKEMKGWRCKAGAIGVDFRGNVQIQTTTDCILYAYQTPKKLKCYP